MADTLQELLFHLTMLREEHHALQQELAATSDFRRRQQLYEAACQCVTNFHYLLQQYQAAHSAPQERRGEGGEGGAGEGVGA